MDVVRKSIFNFQPCSVHLRGATSNCRILKLGLLISYDHIVEIFIVEILSWHCSKRCLTSETIFFPIHPVLCDYLLGCYFEDSGCLFLVIMYLFLISEITCVLFSYFVVILWMDRYFFYFLLGFSWICRRFSDRHLFKRAQTSRSDQPNGAKMAALALALTTANPRNGEKSYDSWWSGEVVRKLRCIAKYAKSIKTLLPPNLARNARLCHMFQRFRMECPQTWQTSQNSPIQKRIVHA